MNLFRTSSSNTAVHLVRAAACITLLSCSAGIAVGAPGDTELISVNATTGVAVGFSTFPVSLSGDGRYVAFSSAGLGLVPGETKGIWQVYVRDRLTGGTRRASATYSGAYPNGTASGAAISADGRYVSFQSYGSNLVAGDTNDASDVFVRDLVAGVTERISVNSNGVQGNGYSEDPWTSISGNGRYVAFASSATNLVPGDTNEADDVFVRDRQTGLTERVSVDSNGRQGDGGSSQPFISADGRYVAFRSSAATLIPGDTNAQRDIFVHDRVTGRTERVSVDSSGTQANSNSYAAALSSDGRYVAFVSDASNLVPGDSLFHHSQAYVHDRWTGVTECVSVSSGGAKALGAQGVFLEPPAISGDGRYVAFASDAANLVPGDTNRHIDSFVHDRETAQTSRVSVSSTAVQGNGDSIAPALSADGRLAGFVSSASNLAPNDPPVDWWGKPDVFVHELGDSSPVAYHFTLRPLAIDFGAQALNTSTTEHFWLRNRDSVPLPVTSIGLRGADRAMFTVHHRCGTSVAVGSGCSIFVTFTPTSTGTKSATLRVVAGDNQIRNRPISGTGTLGGLN